MLSFTKILCPTDFSEPSLCALKAANEMAHHFDSELILLNIRKPIPEMPRPRVKAPETTFDFSGYESELDQHALEALATIRRSVVAPQVNTRLLVKAGKPAEEILRCAHDERVDAIFMATHGRTGLQHVVFGSVAEKVVRQAECPVMTFNVCDNPRRYG
ncbi:MAG: universal stress protein [Candidatus Krumholzibacteriia bacterium]